LIFLALFAMALAQYDYNFQYGPFSVHNLTSGVAFGGQLNALVDEDDAYYADLFSFFVPENAALVNIYLSNDNSDDCTYLDLRLRVEGLPCVEDVYDDYYGWICSEVPELYDGVGDYSYTEQYYVGETEYLWRWEVNRNWYFAVHRESEYYYDYNCPYTLVVTTNATCPQGTVAEDQDDYEEVTCSTPYTYFATLPQSWNITGSGTDDDFEQTIKITVPSTSVGHIFLQLNSTDEDFYLYGAQYAGASDYSNDCYLDDYTYPINDDEYFVYDFYCYVPRQGDFFISITNPESTFNLSRVYLTWLDCPAGMGGYNCTFPSQPWNVSVNSQQFFIAYNDNNEDDFLSYPFSYVYFDIPMNYTGPNMAISVTNSYGEYGYAFLRINGFPEEDYYEGGSTTSQEVPAIFYLNDFDYFTGGRFYIGLECDNYPTGAPGCNFTVSTNATGGGSSTTSSGTTTSTTSSTTARQTTTATTTGSTTGRQTTTASTTMRMTTTMGTTGQVESESSNASVLVPAMFALIVAVLAF